MPTPRTLNVSEDFGENPPYGGTYENPDWTGILEKRCQAEITWPNPRDTRKTKIASGDIIMRGARSVVLFQIQLVLE